MTFYLPLHIFLMNKSSTTTATWSLRDLICKMTLQGGHCKKKKKKSTAGKLLNNQVQRAKAKKNITPHSRVEEGLEKKKTASHQGNDQISGCFTLLICTQCNNWLFVISLCVVCRPYETCDIRLNALDTLPSSGYLMYVGNVYHSHRQKWLTCNFYCYYHAAVQFRFTVSSVVRKKENNLQKHMPNH